MTRIDMVELAEDGEACKIRYTGPIYIWGEPTVQYCSFSAVSNPFDYRDRVFAIDQPASQHDPLSPSLSGL